MTNASEMRSGKTHRDENFPVASLLVRAQHRRPILAFYEFARVADDVADHPSLTAAEKIELLDRMEADLIGDDRAGRQSAGGGFAARARGARAFARARARFVVRLSARRFQATL